MKKSVFLLIGKCRFVDIYFRGSGVVGKSDGMKTLAKMIPENIGVFMLQGC